MTPTGIIGELFGRLKRGDRVMWLEDAGDVENGPSGDLDEVGGVVIGFNASSTHQCLQVRREDGREQWLSATIAVEVLPRHAGDALDCPFCGHSGEPKIQANKKIAWVECPSCFARGPQVNVRGCGDNYDGVAMLRWNTRGGVKPHIQMRGAK